MHGIAVVSQHKLRRATVDFAPIVQAASRSGLFPLRSAFRLPPLVAQGRARIVYGNHGLWCVTIWFYSWTLDIQSWTLDAQI